MNKNKNITKIFSIVLVVFTAISAAMLLAPISFANSAVTTTIVTVPSACSITANNTIPHSTTVFPGHEATEIGNTTMVVECNDASGSAVYAVGYSNNTWKNTDMIDTSTNNTIPTGTGTSASNWSMKLSIPTGNTNPTIRNDETYNFTDYERIPDDYALVASFPSSTDGTSNSSFSATYRTYVGRTQAPGTYAGKVKYTLVHPSASEAPLAGDYMQEMTLSQCQKNVGTNGNAANIGDNIVVYDKRKTNYASGDNGSYTVRYINGQCWMTQNLRITGTISETYSNFTGNDIDVSAYDLKDDGDDWCSNINGYNNACSHTPDDDDLSDIGNSVTAETVGVWYNYYAATAGTVGTNTNTNASTNDICPENWHLPTGAANNSNSELYGLFQSSGSEWITNNNLSAFGGVPGGYYYNGELNLTTRSFWWSATSSNDTQRYGLDFNNSNSQFNANNVRYRYYGLFVRCVMDAE